MIEIPWDCLFSELNAPTVPTIPPVPKPRSVSLRTPSAPIGTLKLELGDAKAAYSPGQLHRCHGA